MARQRQILVVALGDAGGVALLVSRVLGKPEVSRKEAFTERLPTWVSEWSSRDFTVVAPFGMQTLISIKETTEVTGSKGGSVRQQQVEVGGIPLTVAWREEQLEVLLKRLLHMGVRADAVIPPALGLLEQARSRPRGCLAEETNAGRMIVAWQPEQVYVRTGSSQSAEVRVETEAERIHIVLTRTGWEIPEARIPEALDGAPASLMTIAETIFRRNARNWNILKPRHVLAAKLHRNKSAILSAGACFCAVPLALLACTLPAYAAIEEEAATVTVMRAEARQKALEIEALEARKVQLETEYRNLVDWRMHPSVITETLRQLQQALETTPELVLERIEIGTALLITGSCGTGGASAVAEFAGQLSFRGEDVGYEIRPVGDKIQFRLSTSGKEAE